MFMENAYYEKTVHGSQNPLHTTKLIHSIACEPNGITLYSVLYNQHFRKCTHFFLIFSTLLYHGVILSLNTQWNIVSQNKNWEVLLVLSRFHAKSDHKHPQTHLTVYYCHDISFPVVSQVFSKSVSFSESPLCLPVCNVSQHEKLRECLPGRVHVKCL